MKQQQYKAFGEEDYKKVHELAYEYKTGSREAGEKLLERFSSFLGRYVSLLHYGYFDIGHSSIRNYIKLYVENKTKRSAITSYLHNKGAGQCVAQETVERMIPYFSSFSKEDISQEVSSTFLKMVTKYKDTKPSFQNYIDKNFHFYLFKSLNKHSRDPLARGECINDEREVNITTREEPFNLSRLEQIEDLPFEISMQEKELEIMVDQMKANSSIPTIEKLNYNKSISIFDNSFLTDPNWINGITCGEAFKSLTPFERRIIVMWYIENKTDLQIANEFGLCRGTINNRRAKAKDKLEEEIKKLNLIVR